MDMKTAPATNDVLNVSSEKKSGEETIFSCSFEQTTQAIGENKCHPSNNDKNPHFNMKVVTTNKNQQMTNSIVSPKAPKTMAYRQVKKHPTAAISD